MQTKLFLWVWPWLIWSLVSCDTVKGDNIHDEVLAVIDRQYPAPISSSLDGTQFLKKSRDSAFSLYAGEASRSSLVDYSGYTQLSLTWHPNGKEVVFQEYNPDSGIYDLYGLDIDKRSRQRIAIPSSENCIPSIEFSKSGRYMAYMATRNSSSRIYVYDYIDNVLMDDSYVVRSPYSSFQWKDDSSLIFIEDSLRPVIMKVDIEEGTISSYPLDDFSEVSNFTVNHNWILLTGRLKNEEYFQCFKFDLESDTTEKLTEGDFNVTECTYSDYGPYYYYSRNEKGLPRLYCSDLRIDSIIQDVSTATKGYQLSLELSKDDIYLMGYSLNAPMGIEHLNLGNRGIKPINTLGERGLEMPAPEFLDIENHAANTLVKAFFWPSNNKVATSEKTALYIHGGPFLQSTPMWSEMVYVLTQYGFNVLSINYQGSSGYSNSYARKNKVPNQISDIVASIHFLEDYKQIGTEDIILMGSSYGGMLAAKAGRYVSNIGGVVLISGDMDSFPRDWNTDIMLLGFYGEMDPISEKMKFIFNDAGLLNSKNAQFTFFEKEGHLFHRSTTWANIYSKIINTFHSNAISQTEL